MDIIEIKSWVSSNVYDYEPMYDDYDVDCATNDMLYNFFTYELDMYVEPHNEDVYEWLHKDVLVNEFKTLWIDVYGCK